MLRGTRILMGEEASRFNAIIDTLRRVVVQNGYQEVIIPSIWEQSTFLEKAAGSPVLGQMWTFKDKGDRDVCLIPEVTGIIQEMYRAHWERELPKPIKLFYVSRCYRYDKPQKGRYREFTQFGVELLGDNVDATEVRDLLQDCLSEFKDNAKFDFVDSVKRGLSYYVEDGFEVECQSLGAQKQIAGGGRYKEGIGWAIGVDRLVLSLYGEKS